MKYEITINPSVEEDNNDITLSLNTANGGSFEVKSYGTKMGFSDFIEFTDAVHEIRQKFAVINGKYENSNDTTGNRNNQAEQ